MAPVSRARSLLTNDKTIMGARRNPPLLRLLGWTTAIVMTLAAVGMIVTSVV
jgi:Mn2+/Fe2+ NRAMP family transporter